MGQAQNYLKDSASQTAGPCVHIGLAPGKADCDIYRRDLGRDSAGSHASGTRITVTGTEGSGAAVKDVLIDVGQANAADPVRNLIDQADRRATLVAQAGGTSYHFGICLQGDGETVFFDV